jgi:hypothetical protein
VPQHSGGGRQLKGSQVALSGLDSADRRLSFLGTMRRD